MAHPVLALHKKVHNILRAHKRTKNLESPAGKGNEPGCHCGWVSSSNRDLSLTDRYRSHVGWALINGLSDELKIDFEPSPLHINGATKP